MKIFNTKVYGIQETIIRSGYPMATEVQDFVDISAFDNVDLSDLEMFPGFERLTRLGGAKSGSGHDCALKGIIVQADIEAPQYFWQQWKRYHFQDIISSQSTMHRITEFDLSKQFSEDVDPRAIAILKEKIENHENNPTPENFEKILANIPSGLLLVAGVNLNYLQIKTMYAQRYTHKIKMWNKIFAEWVNDLPYVKELGVLE